MSENSYSELLKDPRWQKKRLEIFERDNWACQSCTRTDLTLVVHHRIYLPNLLPWEYSNHLLVTLCEHCHERERLYYANTEQKLLDVVRSRFLVSEVNDIADALQEVELLRLPNNINNIRDITTSFVIYHALTNKETWSMAKDQLCTFMAQLITSSEAHQNAKG